MQPKRPRRKRATTRTQRPWIPVALVGGVAILAVVLIVVLSNVFGSSSGSSANIVDSGIAHSSPQEGAFLGQPNAPLTMIEYFRFDCSHCADFALQTAPQIEKDYVDTGKLRIEERALALDPGDLLTASGPHFVPASRAATSTTMTSCLPISARIQRGQPQGVCPKPQPGHGRLQQLPRLEEIRAERSG